jgi:carboxypeptidase C (cathepsin A)
MPICRRIATIFALSVFLPALAQSARAAQDANAPDASKSDAQKKEEGPAPKSIRVATEHKLDAGGKSLAYVAVAETTTLEDAKGKAEAEFFTVSYLAKDAAAADRPITFAFNGGPGSSSVWLHMGLLGPKRVQVPSDAQAAGAPPFPVVDNPDSLLLASDLVFVDPIGTGLSRVVLAGKNADHWGVDEDARSVARFIRRYLSSHDRWASPKYVLGESYGGIRGPLLVRELQGGANSVALNGLVMISPAFDMGLVDGQDNDAALATVVPTYAATAWYHKALANRPENQDAFLAEVCSWVTDEYVPALFKGRDLPDDRREAIVQKLSKYIGISPEYIKRANLRVSTDRFRRELLRDRGLVVGRLDTRYTGTEPDSVGEAPSGDPMSAGIGGAYVATFLSYLRKDLGVDVDREYAIMSEEAGKNWKRPKEEGAAFQGYVDVAPALARGMAENPALRVFVASGLYDIATTFFAEEYVVRRSTMDRSRVTLKRYPAGHMMYVNGPSFTELTRNIREFVARPVKKEGTPAGN